MLYGDGRAEWARDWEGYEAGVRAWASPTAEDARRLLRAHAVPGRSKMGAAEAKRAARELFPEEWGALVGAATVRYRWPVAHALGLSYTELADVERSAGVSPRPDPGSRGSYASAQDARAVYEAAAAYRQRACSVAVRVSYGSEAERDAAQAVLDALAGLFECTPPAAYDRRGGGRALYFEARVPWGEGAGAGA